MIGFTVLNRERINNMELQERLVVNYEDICNVVRRVTDEIKDLRSDSFIRRILSDKDQDALRKWEDLLNKRISDPFSIVIMGDFKRGKSTLINSLPKVNRNPCAKIGQVAHLFSIISPL